ncbi:MAG: gamma-glutamyl-gamma-aminobutyrate hydrolase family protein, partial [Calditrichaceae bacterium]
KRKVEVLRVPWDYPLENEPFDGLLISNGPGNPKMYKTVIEEIRSVLEKDIPVFGICLGHQLMSLAVGADTFKMKYGHRGQNQPVINARDKHCYITSQNHGFAVDNNTLPEDWRSLYVNLNDGTNEGIIHESGRFFSVQFHPEASPGPVDTTFLFDQFTGLF